MKWKTVLESSFWKLQKLVGNIKKLLLPFFGSFAAFQKAHRSFPNPIPCQWLRHLSLPFDIQIFNQTSQRKSALTFSVVSCVSTPCNPAAILRNLMKLSPERSSMNSVCQAQGLLYSFQSRDAIDHFSFPCFCNIGIVWFSSLSSDSSAVCASSSTFYLCSVQYSDSLTFSSVTSHCPLMDTNSF